MSEPEQIVETALATLSEKEKRESAVYLKQNVLEKSASARIGRRAVQITTPCMMVFVDLFPRANWGHNCRYLLIGLDGKVLEKIDDQFPPGADDLLLAHKGDEVEDWMLLSNKPLNETPQSTG